MDKKILIIGGCIILFLLLVWFLYPERSSYEHSAIWGSVGSIDCPCYGYKYLAVSGADMPMWYNCVGYVDKSKCVCNVRNTSTTISYCNIDKVTVEVEFIGQP